MQRKQLNILTVGYENDSYDAQFLRELGYAVHLYHLELRHFGLAQVIDAGHFESFQLIQADARNLDSLIGLPEFDYIFLSRACVDNFEVGDAIDVIRAALRRLRDQDSVVLAHFQTVFLTRRGLSAIEAGRPTDADRPSVYTSPSGKSEFSDRHLVLDVTGENYGGKSVTSELLAGLADFNRHVDSPWLRRLLLSASKSDQHAENAVSTVALGLVPDADRLRKVGDLPGNPQLWATYVRSSPRSSKGSLYVSNILAITR